MKLFHRKFTEAGAPPGSVDSRNGACEPQIRMLAFDPEVLEEWDCATAADAVRRPGRINWIEVRGLGDGSVVREFGELFGLHPLAVSDVINIGQRPKVDGYDGVLYVVLRMVTLDAGSRLHWEQVSLFLGEDFVLTFQDTHQDCLESLRNRIRTGRKQIRGGGADYLATMVIDTIVDGYFPVLEHYGDRLELYEDQILEQKSTTVLGRIYMTKRDLAGFRRATWPLREALSQLMRDEESPLSDNARLHLRDSLDHTMQVVEVNESYRELAASLVDVHMSMVGQRTNEIMRVLTVVSAVFIPLTFVAGIYGMNFDTSLPGNLPELGTPYGYVYFWTICLLLGGSLVVLFRRLGWLGGRGG